MRFNRRQFLTATAAGVAATACETTATPSPVVTPQPVSGGDFPLIVDTATRLDAAKAASLRKLGAATVMRYYDYDPPTLPDKFVTAEEARIIFDAGLSLGVVFQHWNNCFRTFENAWGREDAEQALRLAERIGQPEGSAIYFGVDGDWPYASMLGPVKRYFEDVESVLASANFDIGVYSNGCVCDTIRTAGLASYFWLSGSTAHTGTQAFYNLGRWTLFQNTLDVGVGSPEVHIDTNLANPATGGSFGAFNASGPVSHGRAATQAALADRRFLKQAALVRAAPNDGAPDLASLRSLQNVRVIGSADGWSQVVTQEGGSRRAGAGFTATGYLPDDVLAPMDAFPGGVTAMGLCGSSSEPTDAYKYENCARATDRLR